MIETNHLYAEKTVYAKRKHVSKSDFNDILKMEIEYHLRKYPNVMFKGFGEVRENKDKSKTYPLIFQLKPEPTEP